MTTPGINFVQHSFTKYEGYGRYGHYLVKALQRQGADVNHLLHSELTTRLNPTNITVSLMPGFLLQPLAGRQWVYTMVESDGVPEGWLEPINRYTERLLVPCHHNKAVFEQRGVTVPVHVIPGGTDPVDFPLAPARSADQPFTFMGLGEAVRGVRKGFEQTYSAFYQAFGGDPARYGGTVDVRLIIKTRTPDANFLKVIENNDSRVSVIRGDVDSMAEVYAQADCFVFPSRGEGFGMPARESAMMAIPTIATNWSGLADGLECWGIPLNNYTLVPVPYECLLTRDANWAFPDVHELTATLRHVYEHRTEVKANALTAAAWLRNHQTWDHSAEALIDLLEMYP